MFFDGDGSVEGEMVVVLVIMRWVCCWWRWWCRRQTWSVVDGDVSDDRDCVVEGDGGGYGEPGSFVDGDGGSDSVVDGDHNGPDQSHGESDSDLVDAQGEGGIAGGEAEPGEQIPISENWMTPWILPYLTFN